jgi:tetratricopeptide (TPR) repeat protein
MQLAVIIILQNNIPQQENFFHKSVSLNPNFGYGWLAHGHALSYDKEHEQAMNCYLRALRLLENFAEPRLYTGIEYCHANNFKQAADNIKIAENFCKTPNAVILHELGTVYLYDRDYERATKTYLKALMSLTKVETDDPIRDIDALLDPILDEYWCPLYFNLGYSFFKASKPCTAITFYRKVLQMGYQKANAWAQIGYCYSFAGRPRLAINAFMQSLALNPSSASVKHAYDRAVSIVAQLPSTYLDKESIDVLESLENYPPYKPDKIFDNRPNLARFFLDNIQNSKLTTDQVFNEHRSIPKSATQKTPPSPGSQQQSPHPRCGPELYDHHRPSTAPAAISVTVDPHAWIFRGRPINEESPADIEAFEGDQPPGVRDRETASAEAVMTGRRDSTEDDLLNSFNFDEDLTVRSQYPLNVVVQDPQELFTDWFMADIHNDTVRRIYDNVSTLGPPPIPRRRDLALNEYSRGGGDIHTYFRNSVLRTSRMRGRGRGGRA